MTGFVLTLRWRTSPAMACDAWKRDSVQFAPTDTVDDVRARLAAARGSTAELAADYDPELWLCDENDVLTTPLDAPDILEWTPSTCARVLTERHDNQRRKAVMVFTLPPAATGPPPGSAAVPVSTQRALSARASSAD
jgi:hypothetical protein